METVNSLSNFERVSDCVTDRTVHLGQQCSRTDTLVFADSYLYNVQDSSRQITLAVASGEAYDSFTVMAALLLTLTALIKRQYIADTLLPTLLPIPLKIPCKCYTNYLLACYRPADPAKRGVKGQGALC